jgi:hypothetical protein
MIRPQHQITVIKKIIEHKNINSSLYLPVNDNISGKSTGNRCASGKIKNE